MRMEKLGFVVSKLHVTELFPLGLVAGPSKSRMLPSTPVFGKIVPSDTKLSWGLSP